MKQEQYLYLLLGFFAGIVATVIFANRAVNTNNYRMMNMMGIRQQMQTCQTNQDRT